MLLRRALGEFIGTAFLVMSVVGSAEMATQLTADAGLRLLANAVATGCALFVLVSVFTPVSGASFNPVVSVAGHLLGPSRDLIALAGEIGAQVSGAVAGCFLANLMFDRPLLETASQIRGGAHLYISEALATFGLILVVRGGMAARINVAPLVAAWITGAYWFTSSTSFANPAVTLGRMFSGSFAGIAPASVAGFVAMQAVGGLVAVAVAPVCLGKQA